MTTRALKTNRSLANFASKKVLGKAMTNGEWSELQEIIPSGIQMSTATIFGEVIPSSPANEPTTDLFGVTGTVQYVELVPVEISTSIYDADADTDTSGGEDTPQGTGAHAWYLKLPSDYEEPLDEFGVAITPNPNQNPDKGTGVFVNDSILYESLGKLQAVPTSFYLNPANPGLNPYKPKIYYWNGSDDATKSTNPLSETYPVDWFFDPYNGIVFFQEYDPSVIPYKVGCYIYIGDFSDTTTGGATTLNALTDVEVPSPSNGQVLTYNTVNSQWEAQDASGGGGIERYEYTHSGAATAAGDDTTVPSMDFAGAVPTTADTQVFLNGQLLTGGDTTDVSNGDADYAFSSDTEIRMGFAVEEDDSIVIFHTTTSFSTGKPFITHVQDSSFDNAMVLTPGDGITIQAGANPTNLVVSNTGLLQRTKINQTGLTHSSDVFTFTMGSIDFVDVNHSDDRIDVFVNGILQEKDYNYSFVDEGNATLEPNKLEWIDGNTPSSSDRFTIIIF